MQCVIIGIINGPAIVAQKTAGEPSQEKTGK